METFAWIVFGLATVPVMMFATNLLLFRPPRRTPTLPQPGVSVLIPARNEAKNIRAAVEAALCSADVDLEILVLDDQSEDGTGKIVSEMAEADPRVKLLHSSKLPPGWAGKMWACSQLGQAATKPWLLFIDADVRIAPEAARRLVDHARTARQKPALVSGIPRQITLTWSEKLLIPLIHFVLLGYLPFLFMRLTRHPAFGTAIGQLILVDRERYLDSGVHATIRESWHDGLHLPVSMRKAGHTTDLVDITPLATCRMYPNFAEVWNGLLKNASAGLGSPQAIVPMTTLLIGGQVLPWIVVWFASGQAQMILGSACVLTLLPRLAAMCKFQQPAFGVLFHAPGVLILEVIQWLGFLRARLGLGNTWKGRTLETESAA